MVRALRGFAGLAAVALLVMANAVFAANEGTADAAIRGTTDELRAKIRAHRAEYRADASKFYAMVDEVVVPRFDTQLIGRHVLGRHWKAASEAQRKRFVAAFRNSLVHSYADALLKYSDTVEAAWKPVQGSGDDLRVNVDLIRKDGPPIAVGFMTHRVDGDWKIYDVSVEGISLAQTFRTQFNSEIRQNGMDALIARLEGGGKPLGEKAEESVNKQGG